jgi:hypothetical protein
MTDALQPETPIAEEWKRSADAAAAVHQIRNRLQSIIIEAALLKRSAAAGDPTALARIGTLAQDGATYLELFGELIPRPNLDGIASIDEAFKRIDERVIPSNGGVNGLEVRCREDALDELLRTLLNKAIPFRGFRASRIMRAGVVGDRVEIILELDSDTPFASSSTVTPWMRAQQMARDVGGSLELHSGEPPVVKLHLPKG